MIDHTGQSHLRDHGSRILFFSLWKGSRVWKSCRALDTRKEFNWNPQIHSWIDIDDRLSLVQV